MASGGGSAASTSSSQSLLLLLRHLLPEGADDAVLSASYASALQLLSTASTASSSSTASSAFGKAVGGRSGGEMAVAERIKKRMVREGHDADAVVTFQRLHHKLQKSDVLKVGNETSLKSSIVV
jgi:hypothetical protein